MPLLTDRIGNTSHPFDSAHIRVLNPRMYRYLVMMDPNVDLNYCINPITQSVLNNLGLDQNLFYGSLVQKRETAKALSDATLRVRYFEANNLDLN